LFEIDISAGGKTSTRPDAVGDDAESVPSATTFGRSATVFDASAI